VKAACARLEKSGIAASLFLDPDPGIIEAAGATGAKIVEIHTGAYANSWGTPSAEQELRRIQAAALALERQGIKPHAGHGLNVENVGPLLRVHPFAELSIGHSIVSRAVLVGMGAAVQEMIEAIRRA
jgi:pyridoxine 5-phosphate synthase